MNRNIILGQLVCTANIASAIEKDSEFQKEIDNSLGKYIKGDWGDTCEEKNEVISCG